MELDNEEGHFSLLVNWKNILQKNKINCCQLFNVKALEKNLRQDKSGL
jgi:hypothetical protein